MRCGRCDAVFNALEGLFDLGRDAPPDWEEPVEPLTASFAAPAAEWSTLASAESDSEDGEQPPAADGDDEGPTSNLGELLADPIDAHLFGPRKRAEAAPKPATQLGPRDRVEFSDARFDSDLFLENTSVPDTELVVPSTDAGTLPLESSARPDFVRRADRRARWQRTPVRIALAVACLVAAGVLALQVAHQGRDILAARWPALRPTLAAWCRLAQCRIEAPRRIADLLVETSTLTLAAGKDSFGLSVTLKNLSDTQLTMPWMELTLTDANGRLVARRALSPADFHAADVIAPRAEMPLQLALSTGTPTVVGYVVEIFYP